MKHLKPIRPPGGEAEINQFILGGDVEFYLYRFIYM